MAPSTIYIRASANFSPLSNPSTRRSLTPARIHRCRGVPSRSLWWWGTHGSWSSPPDESIEERLQRHRKIMRHRYSRSLRRRAMWDRDDNPFSSLSRDTDGHLGRTWGACRPVPLTDPSVTKTKDKSAECSTNTRTDFESMDTSFEAFRAAIDRAIQKDAYGTLFGRRLQGPLTEKTPSLISWLFSREDVLQQSVAKQADNAGKKKIEIEVLDNKPTVKSDAPRGGETGTSTTSNLAGSRMSTEYVYNPISGRKVLREVAESKSDPQDSRPLLDALFSEHGYQTPSREPKYHKVHGYTGEFPKAALDPVGQGKSPQSNTGFPSSRAHEYQQLRAATLGNSIDTSAEFHGKFQPEPSVASEISRNRIRRMPELDEHAPLFSGTAYDAKLKDSSIASNKSWLVKEGFQDQEAAFSKQIEASELRKNRLEPSFDRMRSTSEEGAGKKFKTKLQPAVDRVQIVKPLEPPRNVPRPLEIASSVSPGNLSVRSSSPRQFCEKDTEEDMDLLRASDVRAATKSMRTTKQEVAQAKKEKRSQLDSNFDQLQGRPEEAVPDAAHLRAESDRLSRSIDAVRKHVELYPGGIVATTIKSVGIFGDGLKKSEKSSNTPNVSVTADPQLEESRSNGTPHVYHQLATNLIARSENLSSNVKNDEKALADQTKPSKSVIIRANDVKRHSTAHAVEPAGGIRQIYETDQRPINLSPVRNSTSRGVGEIMALNGMVKAEEATAAAEAQPSAKLIDWPSESARSTTELNEQHRKTRAVCTINDSSEQNLRVKDTSKRALNVDDMMAEAQNISSKVSHLEEEFDNHVANDQGAKEKRPHPLTTASVKPGVSQNAAIERHTTVFEPRYIQMLSDLKSVTKQLQELSGSVKDIKSTRYNSDSRKVTEPAGPTNPVQLDTQSTAEAPPNETAVPSSPYLILVYNKTTGEVDQTEMQGLPWSANKETDKANPIAIMGNLNYPAAFVTHFVELEKAGYGLTSGGGDMLVFQKLSVPIQEDMDNSAIDKAALVETASASLRNAIAEEEALAQPEISETIAQPKSTIPEQAATVLNEIPAEIPKPGPAAPAAPVKKTPRSGPKVRRQEHVFSGTLPLRSATGTGESIPIYVSPSHQSGKQGRNRGRKSSNSSHAGEPTDQGIFARTTRTLKRGVIGAAAIGAAAYTVGAVAEGIGAQVQVEGDNTLGPRRRVVMPAGQRAGIYSTESSRD